MKLAIERALGNNNVSKVAEIDAKLEALQKELLKRANSKQGYEDLVEEIDTLREEKRNLLLEDANHIGLKERMEEIEIFINEHQELITTYDEGLVRRLIEKITVFEDHLAFEFKCGIETEVKM